LRQPTLWGANTPSGSMAKSFFSLEGVAEVRIAMRYVRVLSCCAAQTPGRTGVGTNQKGKQEEAEFFQTI